MNKLTKRLSLSLVSLLFLGGCALADSGASSTASSASSEADSATVVAGTGGMPPPYVTVDNQNNLTGYDIDVIKEVFKRLPDRELKLELTDIPSVLTGVNTGNYDIGVNNFSYNEERAQNYLYSYPYNNAKYCFIHHKDNKIESLDQAAQAGLTYIGDPSTNNTAAVKKYNEDHPDKPITIEYSDAEIPVKYQQIEADPKKFAIDDYPIYNLNQENYHYDQLEAHPMSDQDKDYLNSSILAYFLFAKNDKGQALRDEVNQVLKEMAEDGTIKKLTEEHFGQDQTPAKEHYEKPLN
ncbi:transporter substrate-binding domain-containing protein [Aerococcus sp. UMB1112A]|uniref:transporter substrate-binding domain-containing protein n=1 Tax=Aerococcus sp. UMB1112A TaxID=3050609 RepID=UPI00254C9F0C|nr:transporter substrate-binding domain-containing protein [Aerococcus sp. UMB1112A]MDK8502372.1 transporter substrate-binding domain-containing protein [Aerococcus sp. UMB1112A]